MDGYNNNCNSNNNNNNNNDMLFFKVWRNVVIKLNIFKYTKLYIKNREVIFKSIQSLREYKELEFITRLVYLDNKKINHDFKKIYLSKSDFPQTEGILKELDLNSHKLFITSIDIIPQGVEILHFCRQRPNIKISPSELPNSINTISNLFLKEPYIDQQIPTNITSLSFNSLNPDKFYDIKIPNSIVYLNIQCLQYPSEHFPIDAPKTFIPSSVKELLICYNEKYVFPVIPSTVTKLRLKRSSISYDSQLIKGLIPFGVKHLSFSGFGDLHTLSKDSYITVPIGITKLSVGCLPESITTISSIDFGNQEKGKDIEIEENAIPNSVLDLTISFTIYPDFIYNILPKSLTKLNIRCIHKSIPLIISELPSTIKYLKIDGKVIK